MDEIVCLSIYLIHLHEGILDEFLTFGHWLIDEIFMPSIYLIQLCGRILDENRSLLWALSNGRDFCTYPFISSIYWVGGGDSKWKSFLALGIDLMEEISVPIHLSHPFVGGGGGDSKLRSSLALGIDLMDEILCLFWGDESIQESKQKIMSVSFYWCIVYTYVGDSGWKAFLPSIGRLMNGWDSTCLFMGWVKGKT
jgi:hypothetical protein